MKNIPASSLVVPVRKSYTVRGLLHFRAGVGNLLNTRAISKNVMFAGDRATDKAGSSRHKVLFFPLKIGEDQKKRSSRPQSPEISTFTLFEETFSLFPCPHFVGFRPMDFVRVR